MTTETLQCTVVALQGIPVAATTPQAGDALVYNGSSWVPDSATFSRATSGPVQPQDTASKQYVDGLIAQLQARIAALEAK